MNEVLKVVMKALTGHRNEFRTCNAVLWGLHTLGCMRVYWPWSPRHPMAQKLWLGVAGPYLIASCILWGALGLTNFSMSLPHSAGLVLRCLSLIWHGNRCGIGQLDYILQTDDTPKLMWFWDGKHHESHDLKGLQFITANATSKWKYSNIRAFQI